MESGAQTVQKTDVHDETDNRVLGLAPCHNAAVVAADAEVGIAAGAVDDEALLETDPALVRCHCAPGSRKHHTCHGNIVSSQTTPLADGQEFPAPSTVPWSLGVAENSPWLY